MKEKIIQFLTTHEPKIFYFSMIALCLLFVLGLYFYGDVPVIQTNAKPKQVNVQIDKSLLDDPAKLTRKE